MRFTCVTILTLIATAGGCTTRPSWPNPEQVAAVASGVDSLIELRVEDEPIDTPSSVQGSLSITEAIVQSLHHDPTIKIALTRVRAALAQAHQTRLLPNPIVSIILRWPEGGNSPTVEAGIEAPLLSLLRKPGEIDAADKRLRAASAEVVTAVLDVLAATQRRFVEAQSFDTLFPVLYQRAELLDRLVTLARQRLVGGEGTRLDVTTLNVQRVELDIEIAQRQIEKREARLALARLIGRPSDSAQWPLKAWDLPNQPIASESIWVQAALEHRPEIQAKVWEIKAMGADVRLTRWALLDRLEGSVDSEHEDSNWSIGPALTFPLPIFDWGQAKREAADAALLESLHGMTAIRRQVVQEVRIAHASYSQLAETHRQIRSRLIPLLAQRLKEAESAFRAGQSQVTTLIIAEQDFQSGRARMIEMERRTALSLIELHRAVGGPGRIPDANLVANSLITPATPKKEQP